MKMYFDLLREMRLRPAMFVGPSATLVQTLEKMELFLQGFETRESFEEGRIPVTTWGIRFRAFVAKKRNLNTALIVGVVGALSQSCPVPMTVWNDYFQLVDEFEAEWLME